MERGDRKASLVITPSRQAMFRVLKLIPVDRQYHKDTCLYGSGMVRQMPSDTSITYKKVL